MDYLFEKEQAIEFVIFGDIDALVRTCLANIVGGWGQTLRKKINEDNDIIWE